MKKACRKCKIFVKGAECPVCHGKDFTTNWKGRIAILNAEKSEIAQKLGIKEKSECAIKVT